MAVALGGSRRREGNPVDKTVRFGRHAGEEIAGLADVPGIMGGFEPTAEIADETRDRVVAVNLTTMMRIIPADGEWATA